MSSSTIALAAAAIALLSALAAWTALFVQRRNATDAISAQVNIGARTSRAAVVSANRQKWIDAIRDDISDFIATRAHIGTLRDARGYPNTGQSIELADERALRTKLIMLQARIEMRLNRKEKEHLSLLEALDRYDREFTEHANAELRRQASDIFKFEWERLKREAAGIDPFVRQVAARD